MTTTDSGAIRAAKVVPVPSLRFVTGPLSGTVISLEHDAGTIGRRQDNDYVVADPSVSRVHARLTRTDEHTVVIVDLGSSGGTAVNGELVTTSRVVAHGDRIGIGVSEAVLENPVAAAHERQDTTTLSLAVPVVVEGPTLSPRQGQVLDLIAQGMTNAEIGRELGITERTVKAYAQELFVKLGARNRAGAVAEAIHVGLL